MRLFRFFIPALLLCLCVYCNGQENAAKPFVKVSGEVTKPLTLYRNDLAKMQRITVSMKDHDTKMYSYTGVAIRDILELAGVTMGKQLRGKNLTKYMLVKCADGYQVLFSLAELDSSFTDRNIILAYEAEGRPLPAAKGPFKLVVPGEKKPARCGLQVTELVIRFAKE